MNARAAGLIVGAIVLIGALAASGYALGHAGAPDVADAAKERYKAQHEALTERRASAQRELERLRRESASVATKRGGRKGTEEGKRSGAIAAAARGTGPTPVPVPKLPTDITLPELASSTLAERPAGVIIGNHELLEGITWSTWGGEVAEGSASLRGVDCEPSCAEGPETHDPVTLKAWQPSFTPDNVRFYSKVTITRPATPRLTLEIQAY